jgi:2-methylcitrate dehydratase PrpD
MVLDSSQGAQISFAPDGRSNGDELGRILGTWLASYNTANLPHDVLEASKLFMLDALGVIAAGAQAAGVQELVNAIRSLEPCGGLATILVAAVSASPVSAALINATAGHALDYDDTHDDARVHAFSVLVPAALASAELQGGVSGEAALTALALGSEIFCRLGLAGYDAVRLGWHPTAVYGSLAAAVTASRILGVTSEQMTNAIALGFVQTGGTTQSVIDGALSKRLGAGFAARNGMLAAKLSSVGMTGPSRFLEGESGLLHLYLRDNVRAEYLSEGLGKRWQMLNLSIKPYPCCRCSHSVIQIGIELKNQGIKPEQIRSGRLLFGRVNYGMVGASYDPTHVNPVVHSQFNAIYAFSRALVDGEVGLDTFSLKSVNAFVDPLPSRLHCDIDDEIACEAIAPARVELQLAGGSLIKVSRGTMKGSPDDPMTVDEVLAKFYANMEYGLGIRRKDAARIGDLVLSLEKIANVCELPRMVASYIAAQNNVPRRSKRKVGR